MKHKNPYKSLLKDIFVWLKLICILLLSYFLCRILFFAFNASYFKLLSFQTVYSIILGGLRFDISAILYINAAFIVISLFPIFRFVKIIRNRLFIVLFLVVNIFAILLNLVDVSFFSFELRRSTSELFTSNWLGKEFINLIPTLILGYWYILILWATVSILMSTLVIKTILNLDNRERNPIFISSSLYLFFLALVFLGIRGGVQLKPLDVMHAPSVAGPRYSSLVLNTPFTIIRTIGVKIKFTKYFSDAELKRIYIPETKVLSGTAPKLNVVIIILESFGSEYIGGLSGRKNYTPFLDSLMNNSLVFTNAYANGKRSIEAMPAIMAGIPALSSRSVISSGMYLKGIKGIASVLSEHGYTTAFFHAALNGSMGFDNFAALSGFQNFYGMNEYPYKSDFDGNWGIYDEPFLQFFAEKLGSFHQPFMAGIFTLSSHHPYTLPVKYSKQFKGGTLPIHKTIEYVDWSLSRFFKKAEKMSWYKNTLFIITADHTAQQETPRYTTMKGIFSVPIIFYSPKNKTLNRRDSTTMQHSDIYPSLMAYMHIKGNYPGFGRNVFSKTKKLSMVTNYLDGIYQGIVGDTVIQFNSKKVTAYYFTKKDSLMYFNKTDSLYPRMQVHEEYLKAIIQSFNEQMSVQE